jgi:uncharacterized protein (DUF1800 family)
MTKILLFTNNKIRLFLLFGTLHSFFPCFNQFIIMPITPYTGSWGRPQLFHLLRRTLFGVKKADLAYFAAFTMQQTVDALLTIPNTTLDPPVVDYTGDVSVPTPIAFGTTWVNGPISGNNTGGRRESLRGWWKGLMLNQDRNVLEKMVLFWHNHVPISFDLVEPIYCYRYVALLRQYAVGDYKAMLRQMTIEPAMLMYLDGRYNTKTAPNENYGRELQELFTIGKDLPANYTELDVRAAAKALTGWTVDNTTLSAVFTTSRHEPANKVFSAFYNNTIIRSVFTNPPTNTILSTTTGLVEIDALLNMLFANNETANYIIRKLYRFFVYYDINATVESDVIQPLAEVYRNNNYDIKPVLNALFTSQHFYDVVTAQAAVIKNPVDFTIGFARFFGVNPQPTNYVVTDPLYTTNLYKNWRFFSSSMNNMQMRPGNPPDVAGWDAYSQVPNYHELWINAETLRRRKDFFDSLFSNNGSNGMKADVLAFTKTLDKPQDVNLLIDEVLDLIHPLPPDAPLKASLKNILLSGQTSDYYWTQAWTNYTTTPTNVTFTNTVKNLLVNFYKAVFNMAEYHLH